MMRRRDLIKGITTSAAAWPIAVFAQQPAIPVIGFLSFRSANEAAGSEKAFREGLADIGYVDGQSVHIAFRWAEGHSDRLPVLASDLVDNLHVAVLAATGGGSTALVAKAATKTIPIVFTYGGDPIKVGIVPSLHKPEDNITGVTWFAGDLTGKRLALLHDVVSNIATVGLLHNPTVPETQSEPADAEDAARRFNLKLLVLNASTEREIDEAFATFAQRQVSALVVGLDPYLLTRRDQVIGLAARYSIPAIYGQRESVDAGGLMSYGNSLTEAYRHAGLYVGRILRGAKPTDLPIDRLTKFEFVINLTTAKALGLTVPASFLSLADDLIE
jgi:putative tryptophan/tyrosine transport system substrate-binding protein